MGRIIKKAESSEVSSVSLDDEVLAGGADRIPAEQVETQDDAEAAPGDVAPQGRVLRAGEAGRSSEPVTVRPEEVMSEDSSDGDSDSFTEQREDTDDASAEDQVSVPRRSDAEWQDLLQKKVEAARAGGYEEGHDEGYEAGYDDGYEDAESTVRAELDEMRQQLIEDTTRFEQLWERFIDEAESELVELSLELAETIVNAPFTETTRRVSEEAVIEAVTKLSATPPVTIQLHPVDCQRVRESGLLERLQENFDGLTLEPEPDFEEGDWSVSSPTGVVRRRRNEVLETLRSELRRDTIDAEDTSDGA